MLRSTLLALLIAAPTVAQATDEVTSAESAAAVPAVYDVLTEQKSGVTLWRPSLVQDGTVFLAEVEVPSGCGTPNVLWLDKRFRGVRVGTRFQALLPVPLGYVRSGESLSVRCTGVSARFAVPIVEGVYPESVLTVDPKFSQKPPARVRDEQQAIDLAFRRSAPTRMWQESFVRPTAGIETSPFGVRRTFNGKIDSRHRGLDYDGKDGDPIYAANDGVVVLAAEDFYYTGNAVFIDHGDQLFTLYFHLSRLDVKQGDRVSRGQLLGLIGSTGRVTGPHLHFAVKLAGTYVAPDGLLRLQPGLLLSELSTAVTAR